LRKEGNFNSKTTRVLLLRIFTSLWIIFIVIVSLIPVPEIEEVPRNSDKLVHFLIYFITAILIYYASGDCFARPLLWAILISSFIGISVEFLQLLVPYRTFSAGDMIADILGSLFLFAAYPYIKTR